MARILLHIGAPKTASTSLQDFFFQRLHRKNLINYLGKTSSSQIRNDQEMLYYNIFMKIRFNLLWRKDFWDNFENYQQKINSILSTEKINVFSEEVLFNRDKTRRMLPFYERVKRIQALLKEHLVEVFCCLRRQPDQLFSRYVQNYRNWWHYIKNNNSIEKYYQNIILDTQKRDEMLNYTESLIAYRNAFGKVHCLFFEELLEDDFLYYEKIAELLKVKITPEDIVKEKQNVKEKNQQGYITHYKPVPRNLTKANIRGLIYYKFYKDVFLANFFLFCAKVCSRVLVRYNIFLTFSQKKMAHHKLMRTPFLLLNFLDKPKLHPYFSLKQKQTILDLCQTINQELVKENFCKKEDLQKYGYL